MTLILNQTDKEGIFRLKRFLYRKESRDINITEEGYMINLICVYLATIMKDVKWNNLITRIIRTTLLNSYFGK